MARKIEQEYWVKDKGTKEFKRVSRTMQKQLSDIENKSKRTTEAMTKSWGKLIAVIGAAGIGAAFVGLTKRTLEYGDSLNKLNQRLGVSVEDLDKLRKAGELAGVEFNTITRSISIMSRNLEMARTGTGEAAKAMDELGISIKNLEGLNPTEQFILIGEAISRVEDPTRRQAFAMQLLGRSGVDLLSMLPTLRQSMSELNSEWNYDRAKKVADFNDKVTKLKWQFQDMATKIIPMLLPVMGVLVDHFDKFALVVASLVTIKLAAWFWSVAKAVIAFSTAFAGVGLFKFVKALGIMMLSASSLAGAFRMLHLTLTTMYPVLIPILAFFTNPYVLGAAAVIGGVTLAYKALKDELSTFFTVIGQTIKENKIAFDLFVDIKELLMGIWRTIKNFIIPIWQSFKDIASEAIRGLKIVILNLIKAGIVALLYSFERMAKTVNYMVQAWGFLAVAMLEVKRLAISVANAIVERFTAVLGRMQELIEQFNSITPDWANLPALPESLFESLRNTSQGLTEVENDIKRSQARFLELGIKGSEGVQKITDGIIAMKKAVESIDVRDVLSLNDKINNAIPDSYTDGGGYSVGESAPAKPDDALEALKHYYNIEKYMAENARNRERERRAESMQNLIEFLRAKEKEIVGFWAKIGQAIQAAGLTIQRASSIIADHSTDAIMELAAAGDSLSETWEKVKDGFADFAASILRDMARILIRAAIFNATMKALGFMGGVGGGIASALQGFFANGGHLKGNQPAVVGEQGPELFIPDGGGTIMSNAKSNRMMGDSSGGGDVNFTININRPTGSDEESRRQGKIIRDEMQSFFDKRLIYQSKPGGILRPSAAMR